MTNEITAYESLAADVNKTPGSSPSDTDQGAAATKLPELSLEMENEDILKLTDKWKNKWEKSEVKNEWEKKAEENEKYWLGKQFSGSDSSQERAEVDNLIFESLETYLPQATRRNPEPLVEKADGNAEQKEQEHILKVKTKLGRVADKNRLRLKLKKAARHWAIYLLGVLKFGWDLDNDIPQARVIRPKKIILDPDATIDEDGYSGAYIGEHRKMEASKLVSILKTTGGEDKAIEKVEEEVKGEMGTDVNFIEWWTAEYVCWQLKKTILLKKKNPNWNYDKTEEGEMQVDDYGNETLAPAKEVKGINHFPSPRMPYEFLSVFNLGDRPMDATSLIGQNLANQDLINKRNRQITKNADDMNGGLVVSLARSGLTQPQAKKVATALRSGGAILIPEGSPRDAIDRYPAPALPGDVYNQLVDTRARVRDIFGTRGSSAGGIESESTVRGKIISRGLDTDRIGGGISEYLEQLADRSYNWFLQMLYVYSTDFQFVGGAEPPKLDVSVKEGSLLPKDSTTIANQAIELGSAGKMSLVDMYRRLEFPNPEEMAANVWLEANAPELLYQGNPLVAQAIQMKQQAAMAAEQAKMEAEMTKEQMKHGQNMEIEAAKAASKNGGGAPEVALSEAPIMNA